MDEFELEFTRETSINSYYIWLDGYLEACKILDLDLRLPEKTFAILENKKIKTYTQKNNINLIKEAINKINKEKLSSLIKEYLEEYKELKAEKEFLKKLISKFVIIFILGDMPENNLQQEALNARIKTEDLFYIIPENNIYKKDNDGKELSILTRNKIIPITSENQINQFLKENNIQI